MLGTDQLLEDGDAAVVEKDLGEMRLAAIVESVDDYDVNFGVLLPEMFQGLVDETLRIGIRQPTGPIQAHFHRRTGEKIDVVAGVPVECDETLDSETLVSLDIAAVSAVTIVRQGHFAEGPLVLETLAGWLEVNGQASLFDHYREVYLQSEGPPETWVAEYQVVLTTPTSTDRQ